LCRRHLIVLPFHLSGCASRPWQLIRFRQFIDGSLALASLNLTRRDILPTLTATLTTIAFDDSSLQRFEACT
jgi:hypothetical protein